MYAVFRRTGYYVYIIRISHGASLLALMFSGGVLLQWLASRRWENYRRHDIASHECAPASYRVADVGVDVVLNVFQHFVEVAGACRTQEASVAITLSTHIHTDIRLQLLAPHHHQHLASHVAVAIRKSRDLVAR